MWKINLPDPTRTDSKTVFVVDDEGTLRWSGASIQGALAALAEWGQAEVVIGVDDAIFFFGSLGAV